MIGEGESYLEERKESERYFFPRDFMIYKLVEVVKEKKNVLLYKVPKQQKIYPFQQFIYLVRETSPSRVASPLVVVVFVWFKQC